MIIGVIGGMFALLMTVHMFAVIWEFAVNAQTMSIVRIMNL